MAESIHKIIFVIDQVLYKPLLLRRNQELSQILDYGQPSLLMITMAIVYCKLVTCPAYKISRYFPQRIYKEHKSQTTVMKLIQLMAFKTILK